MSYAMFLSVFLFGLSFVYLSIHIKNEKGDRVAASYCSKWAILIAMGGFIIDMVAIYIKSDFLP